MAFSLPSDLPTNIVDDETTADAAFYNNIGAMGNALKAAVGTWGFNTQKASVATSETTRSTTYTDLTTTTDQVTAAIGTSGMALVIVTVTISRVTTGPLNYISYAMSGANTVSATDTKSLLINWQSGTTSTSTLSATFLETGLSAGFTTFKLKYRTSDSGNDATFLNRTITVVPFPSTDGTHLSGIFNLDASSNISLSMSPVSYSAPIFDAVGTGSASHTSVATTTWTHTATSGSTVFAFVQSSNGTPNATANMTYGSRQMAKYGLVSGTYVNIFVFVLFNAPAGQQTVTFNTGGAASYIAGNTVSYLGAKHIAQGLISNLSASGFFPSISAVKAGDSGILVNALGSYRYSVDSVQGGNPRWNSGQSTGYANLAISDNNSSYTYSGIMDIASEWGAAGILVPTSDYTGNPIARDSYAHAATPTAASSLSWTHTVGANATVAVVWVTPYIAAVTSMTFGGTAMTLAGSVDVGTIAGGMVRHYCYYLMNPPTGSQTVSVTIGSSRPFMGTSITYDNVGGVGSTLYTTIGTSATASNATPMIPHRFYSNAITVAHAVTGPVTTGYTQNEINTDYQSTRFTTSVGDSSYNSAGFANFGGTIDASRDWASTTLALIPLDKYPYSANVNLSLTPTIGMTGVPSPPVFQGANAANSTSVTIPTHASGDLILIMARASANGTNPTPPSAGGTVPTWTEVVSGNSSYAMTRIYRATATSDNHTSGTWTNANGMIAAVMRNANSGMPIGASGMSNAASTANTSTTPALTMNKTDGSSALLDFYSFGDGSNTFTSIGSTPTGYTQRVKGEYSANKIGIVLNTKDDTTSDGAIAQTSTSACWNRGGAIEVLSNRGTSFDIGSSLTPIIGMYGRTNKAVTFDSAGAGVVGVAGTTYSWSHTIGANAKALVVVANFYNNGLAVPTFTNAKVGNTTLNVLVTLRNYTSSGWPCYTVILGVLNPPTGVQTVQFTTAATYTGCNSFAYNNVGSFGAYTTTTPDVPVGTPATFTGPATSPENMVLQVFAGYTTAFSAYAGGTERWNPSRGTSLAYVVGDTQGTGSPISYSAVHGAYSNGSIALILNAG